MHFVLFILQLLIVFCDCAAAVQQQQLIRPCSFTDELNGFYASWHTNCSGLVNFVINSYNFPRPKVPSAASGFPAFSPPFTNFWIGIGFRLVSTELIMVENQANGGVLISQARVEPDRLPQRQIGHGILLNPRGSFVGGTTLEATFSIDESLLRGCKEFLFFAMPTPLDVPFAAIPPPHVREVCELGRMCARFPCPPGKALGKQKRSASFGGGGGFGGPVGMMDFIGTGGPQDPTMPMTLMNDIGSMNPSNNVFPLQHLPVFTAPPDSPTPATVLQVPFTVTVPTVTQQISSDLSENCTKIEYSLNCAPNQSTATSLLPSERMLNKSTVQQRNETKHSDTVFPQLLTDPKSLDTVSSTSPTDGTVARPSAAVAPIIMGRRLRRQTQRDQHHTAMFADFAHEHGSTLQGTAYEGQDRQFHRAEPALSVLNPQYEALARYQTQHGQAQMFGPGLGPWHPIDQDGGGLNRASMYWPYRTAVGAADVQGAPQGIGMGRPALTNNGNGEAMPSPPADPFGIGPAMEPPSEMNFYNLEKCDFGTDPDWCGDYVKQFVNWFEQYGSLGKTICSSAMDSLRNSDHRCCNALKKLNC